MKNFRLFSIAVAVMVAGLLLGGNVQAKEVQSATTLATTGQTILQQITEVQQKISSLNDEIAKSKISQIVVVSKPALTQDQLDRIETEVSGITKEVARIKIQVEIYVAVRETQQKIAKIEAQIAALNAGKIAVSTITAADTKTTSGTQAMSKDAQIAKIKQQINELNQELQAKRAEEASSQPMATVSGTCGQGQVCGSSTSSGSQNGVQVAQRQSENGKREPVGFWQSIGNFLRKIFTF